MGGAPSLQCPVMPNPMRRRRIVQAPYLPQTHPSYQRIPWPSREALPYSPSNYSSRPETRLTRIGNAGLDLSHLPQANSADVASRTRARGCCSFPRASGQHARRTSDSPILRTHAAGSPAPGRRRRSRLVHPHRHRCRVGSPGGRTPGMGAIWRRIRRSRGRMRCAAQRPAYLGTVNAWPARIRPIPDRDRSRNRRRFRARTNRLSARHPPIRTAANRC